MKFYKRKTVSSKLKGYDPFATNSDFMEVTEWENGEGFDIFISTQRQDKSFSLTFGEAALLNILVNVDKESNDACDND